MWTSSVGEMHLYALIVEVPHIWSSWWGNYYSWGAREESALKISETTFLLDFGSVYAMDHEVVPGHCNKSVDWLLNSSRDHFGLHQGEHGRVTMEVEVTKMHISRDNRCIDMVQRVLHRERQERWSSRKRQGPMAKQCSYNKYLMNLFLGLNVPRFLLCALIIS